MTRYLPDVLLSLKGYSPVVRSEAFPPDAHPEGSPIIKSFAVVRATLANGDCRWYGCKRAYIDPSLRMVLVGLNPRDYVLRGWTRPRKVYHR